MKNVVLFLIGAYPSIGGVETITTNLANEFVKCGMDVHIVSFEQTVELEKMNLDKKVRVKVLSKPVYSKSNKRQLRDYVRDHKINIVMNQWCLPFYTTMLIKYATKGKNCEIIQIHHNNPVTNARLKQIEIDLENGSLNRFFGFIRWHSVNFVSRLSLRYAYNFCDEFVVLSESFIIPFLKYIWKQKDDKVAVIPNSFSTESDGKLYPKEKEIIFLGRIDYNQKRVRRIIDIWNDLENDYPDWRLTIVGDGPDVKNVKEKVATYGLKHVNFEGSQKPDKYLRRAPIMLLVSEYEGFGIVLAEAQSYGCVPIALDSYSALHDIVESCNNGIIIDYPYSKDKFVDAIKQCIDSEERLMQMALNGMKSVEKFNMNSVLDKWLKLFLHLGAV
jgi:glycosyltransferase involved in cell wall biosynthesis